MHVSKVPEFDMTLTNRSSGFCSGKKSLTLMQFHNVLTVQEFSQPFEGAVCDSLSVCEFLSNLANVSFSPPTVCNVCALKEIWCSYTARAL